MSGLVQRRDRTAGAMTGRLLCGSSLAALVFLASPSIAHAQDRYWDSNGTSVGSGGDGIWDTTGNVWSPSGDGVSGPYAPWDNSVLDNAIFEGTPGTVTLTEPITVHNMTFSSPGYTLTGGTLTLAGEDSAISVVGSNTGANIYSVIAGDVGLTKNLAGVLRLYGANTFTGDVLVNAGTLTIDGNGALGDAANGLTLAAGTALTLTDGGSLAGRTITLSGGQATISGAGAGAAHFTGAGGIRANGSITLDDDTNDYAGRTSLVNGGNLYFSSIGDIGEVSALGAATDAVSGTIALGVGSYASAFAIYTGDGDRSNRDWQLGSHFYQSSGIVNQGTGTLTLTGNIVSAHTASSIGVRNISFNAATADLELLGTISSNNNGVGVVFTGGVGRTITLGGANTFGGGASIQNLTMKVESLKNTGTASALGTGETGGIALGSSVLSYIGGGDSSDRIFGISGNSTIANDGTGALALSGDTAFSAGGVTDTLTLGGSFTGTNTFSGVVSGAGDLRSDGVGAWVVSGANTFAGNVIVDSGTLRAGGADAFGASAGLVVNGGTLDLGGFDLTAPKLEGLGGEVSLGANTLTVDSTVNTAYAGNISGSGRLRKTGIGTLTLSGANSYTGATSISGGTLELGFNAAGAPTGNIIASASTLDMAGGALSIVGADGVANSQSFDGLTIAAGSNRIAATPGAGGSVDVNFGAITRTGGLVDFVLPGSGSFTTSNTSLGGWATVNGSDYAKVDGSGVIAAFTEADYSQKDDAANWLDGEVISDVGGDPNTAFYGTVNGNRQIGGLKYTAAAASTVAIDDGEMLGIDGTIIVAESVGNANQAIAGGSITGGVGGTALGILQNSTGTGKFTIGSVIVDNDGATGFTKGGDGIARLTGSNTYTGATILSGGTLEITSLAGAGQASSIGAASADSSNLVLEAGLLHYDGAVNASTDRGFTLVNAGAEAPRIGVDASRTVEFSGLVTSPDDAGLTKVGWGTLVLSNAANDYIGVTTIRGGGSGNYSTLSVNTLADGGEVSGIGAAGSESANLVLSTGGRLRYTGGTVAIDRGFTLEGGGRIGVAQDGTTLTIGGTAVGTGGLVKDGAGTLVLTGTNSYTGGTIVNAGTLRAGSIGAFGPNTSPMGVNAGATFDLGGLDIKVGALTNGAGGGGDVLLGSTTLSIGGANGNFAGIISGTGGLIKTPSGTQILSGGHNSYTGVTTFNGGTLSVGVLADGGDVSDIGASGRDAANMVFTGGRLTYTGGSTSIDRGFTLLSGDGYINVSNAATTLEFEGDVVGAGRLRKEGSGTLVLSGTNTYAGNTIVSGGILQAGSNDALGTAGYNVENVAGAAVDLNGFDSTLGYLNGGGARGGNITLGTATLTLDWGSGGASYAGVISGTGGLIKHGGVDQALTGCASDYSGATTINGGILTVSCLTDGGAASSIGASAADAANLVINGGTLRYAGAGGSTDRRFTLGASGGNVLDASGTGAIEFASDAALTFSGADTSQTLTLTGTNDGDNILAAELIDNGTGKTALTKDGAGTWILTNPASSYTGRTVIDGGVLGVDKLADGGVASSLGASSADAENLVIGNGSTLRYTGAGDTTNRLFTLAAGTTFIESSGTGAIVFTDTGPVTLADNNQNRTIALGGGNTGNNTLAGSIGDAGTGVTTLAKNDAGTWVLTGENSYTGNTVINDGHLIIGDGGSNGNAGTGDVIVDAASSTLSFNRSDTFDFTGAISGSGRIAQIGIGTTVLTAVNSIDSASIEAGTLQVDGALRTANIGISNAGTLSVNGVVQGAGGAGFSMLSGTSGENNVIVNTGGMLYANGILGDGTDVVTLAGLLDTGNSLSLDLGGGDDLLTLNDGSEIAGVINAGSGTDRIVVDNALAQTLDAAQVIGFEALEKQNAGVLTLTGDHAYGDGIMIDAGTLQVGDGDISGSIAANVANDGILAFNRSDSLTYAGVVSGDGSLVQQGTGTLVLTGTNSYTGGTTIADGTLQIGNAGASGEIVGDVTNNGVLAFNRSDSLTFAGDITGTGALTKQGAGMLTMTGVSTYTGATTLNAGQIMLQSGGRIDGTDSLTINGGAMTVSGAGAGLIAGPGNSLIANGTSSSGTLVVTDGGTASFVALDVGHGLNSVGVLNIGAGSHVTQTGAARFGTLGQATVNITDGGAMVSSSTYASTVGGQVAMGNGYVTVSGAGSSWSATNGLFVRRGRITVADGGVVTAGDGTTIGYYGVGLNAPSADVIVTGAGSRFETTGTLTITNASAASTRGALTIADGGLVKVGSGTLELGVGDATLNIGGAEGDVAAHAGTLDAAAVTLAAADNRINFNHDDAGYQFSAAISGAGAINQLSGTTILTGDSAAFSGTTSVTGGALHVNNALGGDVAVATGGTLGGSGTIGGDVTIADDGILAPGNSPGTLAISGDLALSSGAILNYEFGEADVAGGALNDLVTVGGDLALDGTLNVAETPGGTFGAGIYRVFTYEGTLTDNGLALGTMPTGSDLTVQTAIGGQVNLVNTAGLQLSVWDGDAGPKFDGNVNGGDGFWQSGTGNDNWTNANGTINAAYADGSFAIFQRVAGTVTVDNSLGTVSASGMQFTSDGYLIDGDDIALLGPQATIRVGDGSATDADLTATIASALTGATELVKTDGGTLVLTGTNSYSLGTTINSGTLQLGDGGTSGSILGDVVNNGSLVFNRSNTVTFAGAITGTGAVHQIGTGTVTLTADNSYTGETRVQTGVMKLSGGGKIDGTSLATIRDGGTLTVSGTDSSLATVALAIGDVAGNSAALNVENGGAVNVTGASSVIVGIAGDGVVTVDGAGSTLTVADALQLGGAASGLLNLTNGGQAFSASGMVGAGDGGGEVLVSGPGSLWENTGNLTVGTYGAGKLTIGAGATVMNADGVIDSDASGGVIVTGAGSTWTNAGQLTIGSYGLGMLSIEDGATVTSNQGYIGSGATGDGSVIVTGAGSSWTTALNINVGNYGTGSLTVDDGALVRAALGVDLGFSAEDADGTLTVQGTAASRGILETSQIRGGLGTANALIDGGIIRAIEDNADFVSGFGAQMIAIDTDGAEIDTNGHDIGIATQFVGTGDFLKSGAGALSLSGANVYDGDTTVAAGTLLVNGDQSGAAGLTNVLAGATLGGIGTIGGDVTLTGGTINPGESGAVPATLTINGALSLGSASALDYNLGQAGVVGGAFNDLIEVGGDLVLDGTLNVDVSAGGSFDPGLYRVISYGGSLTDNGLWIGTIPSPDFYVQTSVAGQVNLVNTAGMTMRYWDGATPTSKNNDAIEGGDGVWQGALGNDNWTEEDGASNAPFTDNAFAVFMGASGTVTVDSSTGPVNASGMQLLTDGYVIGGDAINLVGTPTSVIRVGDGTVDGAAITATIASELSGASGLTKTDLGTLILTGVSAFDGDMSVDGGTVRISDDGSVSNYRGYIGTAEGQTGTVMVSGPNASWINDSHLYVGYDGGGALEIRDGADVSNATVFIGLNGDATGSVIVSGVGSTWTNTQNLYVGNNGDGTLTVEAGGVASASGPFALGVDASSTGSATITGTGSKVTTISGLFVGNSGEAELTIADGGAVSGSYGEIGYFAGSSGTINIGAAAGDGPVSAGSLDTSILTFRDGDGTLVFNHTDTDYVFATGLQSNGAGAHSISHLAGTTLFTGDSAGFTGATTVSGGTLLVGDAGGTGSLGGTVDVTSGGTLGGSGTIGGNVTIGDGGTLAPGNSPGTLTIGGSLTLDSGSTLNFEFGEANVAGGALNDLVDVGGDLTLDGTLNVSVAAGGTFGPGIYRVFNYGGDLTDHGLALGTMPGGAAATVQTAIDGQVNLVSAGSVMLNFWDGDAGPKNNDAVNGGDGVWRVGGGINDWTDQDGSINADYAQDSFAIFAGASGTVTVDNSGGDVRASGMQFASGGYRLTGDALTLTGTEALIRVGDSSNASVGYTATIDAELAGAARLVKTDAGTLILTADNSYTGGTTISNGTLQIGNGGESGSVIGDIVNNGALMVNRSDTLTLDGTISGSGSLTQFGGTLVLTGANSYAGGTFVAGGTIRVSSDANLGDASGALSLQGGTLQAGASFASSRDILVGSTVSNSIDTQGFDVTLGGVIGDGPNNAAGNFLNKLGAGTLTLTGANSYSNRTVIAGGTLALAGAGTIGAGNLVVGSGTVFDISQADIGARVVQLSGAADGTIALGAKTLTLGLDHSYADWSGTIVDGGIGGGVGGRVVITASSGAVRFYNANSYTGGTTVAAGTFALAGNGALNAGGAVAVNAGAAFDIAGLTGAGTTIGDVSGAGAIALGAKTLTFGTGNDTAFAGAVAGNGGALVKAGAGTFTFTGDGSYTGGTTIAAGTLRLGDGGNGGAIVGDVIDNGTLAFDRADAVTFAGAISGSGAVSQSGSGTTILTGANSYTGATSVVAGTLLVNGDQSGATGLTSVASGATLGGGGTIGGDVAIADGGILAPGNSPGTLAITGDLMLSSGATLAVELGEANVPGGPLNDLVNVGGGLTLDGTVDVAVPVGGDFGPGVYRLINYTGALTDNGLTVGVVPGGADAFVQTAIANQVNLVNTAGLTLNFWDGAAGPKNDGAIDGGNGVWRVGGGTNAWTESSGAVNADYAQGSFAIFQAAPGAVTIDNSGGDVLAAGMQFVGDGYVIDGDALTLTGTDALIRVGDGSATDAGIAATIDAELGGSARLVKDLGGTLVLTGTSSYTGGTAINGGTLRIASNTNLGDAAGGLSFDGGTLQTIADMASGRAVELAGAGTFLTDAGTTLTLDGLVSGAGALTKDGAGALVLTGNDSYAGGTTIAGGTLQLGDGGASGSILGDVTNDGALVFDRSDEVTFAGLISGSGAVGQIGTGTTILTADSSYAGGTTIAAGMLQLGDGGASGSIAGDVVNNGVLAFNRSDEATFAGLISGSGSVHQIGSGVTVLAGLNTYAGGTAIEGGTVQVSADANLGDAAGGLRFVGGTLRTTADIASTRAINLAGSGTFLTDAGTTFALGGIVSGAGSLTKSGAGALILTADNGYAGGTTVAEGTLQLGGGGASGAIIGDVVNDGVLAFNRSDDVTFAGLISGTGSVSQIGTGATILTADSSYTGGTTIDAGTLQLGDGGARGSIVGNVANNGALAFDRLDEMTLAGVISGSGAVSQIGTGTTILAADNDYTGGTTIDAGVLQLGDGGTTGSILGDVVDNGTLAFNRSDDVTFAGLISGSGDIEQAGAGMTILTGGNRYAGATNVNAGMLLVNGDQSMAMGLTSVASGATLGGMGVIGGDVTVADGGILAPGAGGAGTLTINGLLALSGGSTLAYEFGQANHPGGPLNDVIEVGGDLTLDGTIDVAVSLGGSFDIGLYRIADYGGVLTDNGLAIGAMPAGSNVFVQTAIGGQVNLVNTGSATLNFWDGAAGPTFNGAVNGGDGVWQSGAGNANWADRNGVVNAPYADGAVAIFSTAAGTVTIDNGPGAVTASGMQFASDGYVLTGDALTLTAAQSVIRVGDGTAAGAGYSATINAELAGAAQLVKTGAGTLVLAGANSYTGGTAINGGTVQIVADANLGDAAGGLSLDGGTLNSIADVTSGRTVDLAGAGTFLTDAGTTLTLGGAMSGAGGLTKDGAGTLILAVDNDYAGGTTIGGGILQLGDGGAGGSIIGDVMNDGTLAFDRSGSMTMAGRISGSGDVRQIGGGTIILTADNSYTGGTTIDSGILQLGDGGASGSIVGDVANNSTLAFSRSDDVAFAGLISGSGSLTKDGAGTLELTGANGYAGATTVAAGTLLVNGDQSAATGLTTVAAGGTLGGTGIIGGNVALAGTLAAGSNGVGTLTINGSLELASGSTLDFEFGEAGVAGGSLNDLVNVGGDLVLDGTLNVSVPTGGSFGPGIYRVFTYGGALADNGLALGAMPGSGGVSVQTAIGGQVNLVNTAGLALSFWDGDAGPKNNAAIDGGDGVWRVGGGLNDWADMGGAVNADYAQGSFAIFSGASGTVTIDDIGGGVLASGMQFAGDGYVLTGDALTLTGTDAIIQVGDSGAASAGYGATIDGELTGAARLVKTDAGTLVLSGMNSYTGGTAINGGTVRIAADANLGDTAGGLGFDGGTLHTTADIASNRAVDLAGAGTFLTDTGTTLALNGAVSGAGSFTKNGAGMLILAGSGDNSGGINVGAGALWVNGDFADATGLTSVASGATLGGTGTIGGDVALADGAILTPGAGGVGTLAIGGSLSLGSGSSLAFEFGEADAAGGALNDLVTVGGDLMLDGTVDVTVPAGGAFDAGVYRLFDYGGALTDNGLALGVMPAGSNVAVQTSIAGQVNLVNSAGLALNLWDGAAGPRNDGVIQGGSGIWQNSIGNDNWADADGTVNAAYADGAFAVFGGTGGTVTVDNSLGAVTTGGMQFAADGYTITGDALALTDTATTVRVGDGSTAGADMTATIDAALTGDSQLVKTDAGTLILGGMNSYTGGTAINGGTVQIAADANLGDEAGDVVLNGGTLATTADLSSGRAIVLAGDGAIATADDTTFTFEGLLSGTGTLTKQGAGTLLLTGDNDGYTAAASVAAGTLAVDGVLGGAVAIDAGARLAGSGRVDDVANNGVIAPGRDGFGTLTVGAYAGKGGVIEIETALGGDASETDRLVVTGGTSGATEIAVANRGGLGAQTVEGIKLIDVTGGASDGTFALRGDYVFEGDQAVIAGAYGYRLYQGGVSTPNDGDWYLRSALLDGPAEPEGPLYQPGVPIYENYAQTLQTLGGLPALRQRVGNRSWAPSASGAGNGIWGRMESARFRPEARASTTASDLNVDSWRLQAGVDRTLSDSDGGQLVAGITAHYGKANGAVRSIFGNGAIHTKGYGVGATLTWYAPGGFYVDGQAQFTWFDTRLTSSVLGTLADGNDGRGRAVSLEAGKRSVIGGGLTLTPQIQMSYQNVDFDAFDDPSDARVSSRNGDSLKTRWGISIDHDQAWNANGSGRRTHLYGLFNLNYEWLDGTRTDVSGTPIRTGNDRLWGEAALGGSLGLGDRLTIYTQVSASSALRDFGDSYSIKGTAGVRLAF